MMVVLRQQAGSRQKLVKNACLTVVFFAFLLLSFAVHCQKITMVPDHSGDWVCLREGFQLREHSHGKEVCAYTERYGQRYFNYVQPQVQLYQRYLNIRILESGLPAELALLPLIESGLKGHALSSAKAAGFWQFTEGTAKCYGLTVNKHFDGRKDFILSTEAAIAYLQDMHHRLDNWLLVIAAYNAGEGCVRNALKKASKNGKKDFWQLSLPAETRQHVARLLALSRVIQSSDRYHVLLPSLEIDGMDVFYPDAYATFGELAACFQCSETLLRQFNPGYLAGQYDPSWHAGLVLPRNKDLWLDKVSEDVCSLWNNNYVVSKGDTLSVIAKTFRIHTTQIQRCNKLTDDRIFIGQALKIPVPLNGQI